MRHKLLGRSGLRVSELCLGSMTFGEGKAWGTAPEEAAKILAAFADAGGTFIDTAPGYAGGASEEIVGRFVSGRRDDFAIATKFTASANTHPLAGGNSRKAMVSSVEASLARVGTDHIDLLWLHYWDGTTPLDEILRGLDDLTRAGKILYAGLSDTPAWLASRAVTMADLRGWAPIVATQLEYNIAARTAEGELLPMAEALDLGVVCWGPLAAGALAGGSEPQRLPAARRPAPLADTAAAVRAMAEEAGLTAPGLALRWIMRRASCIPLIGARTAAQLNDTLAAAASPIDAALLDRLDAIAPPDPGFPHALIGSSYLRRLALGDPERIDAPRRARA